MKATSDKYKALAWFVIFSVLGFVCAYLVHPKFLFALAALSFAAMAVACLNFYANELDEEDE